MTVPAEFDWKSPNYTPIFEERIDRLKRLRSMPEIRDGVLRHYADHPVDFINDWGMTFDPRNVERGIQAVTPFLLFPKQSEFIEWVVARWRAREDGLVEKSRDAGVSWLCVAVAVWMWRFHAGVVVGFGSRKEAMVDDLSNPSSLFWKIRQFIELLPVELRPKGWNARAHAPFMKITNPENGSVIVGEAGANIGRGARASIYFKDESAFYEQAEVIDAALSQTANCKIDVSTPNGAGNVFYRKRHSGKIPVFTFHWRSDLRKDEAWYQKQKETLDPTVIAAELDLDYTASVSNAWIDGQTVTACLSRGPADVRPEGPLLVGVDVARFGDDKSCITFRQGRVCYPQIVFGQCDVVDVYSRVRAEIDAWRVKPSQIAVDTIGIGAGVADMLRRDFGRIVQDVNSSLRMSDGQNYNLRARIWRDMREWLKNGASLPNDGELATDLTALQYEFRGGELLMESKEKAKGRGIKSPDRADSLALTFAYPVRDVAELPRSAVADYSILG